MRYKTNLKTTVTFRLDKRLKREIKRQARLDKVSPSAFVEQLIIERFVADLPDAWRPNKEDFNG